MMQKRLEQKGYSLVEALIAVALLAGLSSTLGPAMFSSMRISSAVLQNGKDQEALRIVDESLSSIFANAVLVSQEAPGFVLEGDARALQLVSLAGSHSTARMFRLTITNESLYGEIDALNKNEATKLSTTLFEGNIRQFSYYGRPTGDAPLGWRNDWDSKQPPQLVRLEISSEDNAQPIILEYPVNAQAPLHCAFDPVSRRCRS